MGQLSSRFRDIGDIGDIGDIDDIGVSRLLPISSRNIEVRQYMYLIYV